MHRVSSLPGQTECFIIVLSLVTPAARGNRCRFVASAFDFLRWLVASLGVRETPKCFNTRQCLPSTSLSKYVFRAIQWLVHRASTANFEPLRPPQLVADQGKSTLNFGLSASPKNRNCGEYRIYDPRHIILICGPQQPQPSAEPSSELIFSNKLRQKPLKTGSLILNAS